MRSLQIKNVVPLAEQDQFSDLKVMKSGAGYYVGTTYTDPATGYSEPGSRDTDYYTKEDAERVLAALEKFEKDMNGFEQWLIVNKLDPRGVGYRLNP
jgi:hypothetical protein